MAGAAVFVAALAMPLDDPALVMALMLGLRSGRMMLDVDSRPGPAPPSPAWTAADSFGTRQPFAKLHAVARESKAGREEGLCATTSAAILRL